MGNSFPVLFLYCSRIKSEIFSSLACSIALSLSCGPWPRTCSWTKSTPLSSKSSFFSLSLPPPAAWLSLSLMPERNPPLSFLWSVEDDCSFWWLWLWPLVNLLTKSIVDLFIYWLGGF
ncbi:hypothetical protein I7I50_06353 [Histoplasma capsulatum G186AR]|uniref:Uncharacterized protein n=1 Tax=Ajellomyces capsulatus TaxID=5037 RepID=A0A8H7YXX0_AJECA|nr:hypothetical protein I7I52_10574 [Histoplasma capsulatum]QSS67319.1 hypothetical protein I7I50_06353 [Histoplasma capsulatum G186AR]